MDPLRGRLSVPGEHLGKGPRRRGGRYSRAGKRTGKRHGLRSRGLGGQDRVGEVSGSPRVRHDSIGETDPEHVLQAHEQFDPLEASNAQVTIERVVELDRGASRRAAQLGDERPHDVEDLPLGPRAIRAHERSYGHARPPVRGVTTLRVKLQARCLGPAPQKTGHVWRLLGVAKGNPRDMCGTYAPTFAEHCPTTRTIVNDKLLNPQRSRLAFEVQHSSIHARRE